jgi:L-threonylcarbamoyladenylate synthase
VTDSTLNPLILEAAQIIKRGGVVAFPTETVYGLGADAFNPLAVARVFEVKKRPSFDPLIVHVDRYAHLEKLVAEIPSDAKKLIERFWPGPLTVVLLKSEEVPEIVTAGLLTVAIRMPDHPIALRLIETAGSPIAAPSANPFGYLSPTTAEHVREQLGHEIDFILDGGPCRVGVESTILAFSEGRPELLRPGGLSLEEIESTIGKVDARRIEGRKPGAPGMLPTHYAPRTPMILRSRSRMAGACQKGKVGILALRRIEENLGGEQIEILSEKGDLREAAANLFAAIRRLDALNLDLIVAETVPEEGLGLAIMDRLRRASHKERGFDG